MVKQARLFRIGQSSVQNMDNLLQQGVQAYRAGRRDEARKVFIALVKQNQDDERAWGWMYSVCNTDPERIHCLKQVVRINPKNEKANQLLNQLTGFDFPLNDPQPTTYQTPSIQTSNQTLITNSSSTLSKNLDNISVILIVILVVLSMFWMGIGLLQIMNSPLLGFWNIFISLINLGVIRDIIKHSKNTLNELYLLAILGTIGGAIQMITGAYLQACVIPLYGALGILTYINQDVYKVEPAPSVTKKKKDDTGTIVFYAIVGIVLLCVIGLVTYTALAT
jgi:hypothetical protein